MYEPCRPGEEAGREPPKVENTAVTSLPLAGSKEQDLYAGDREIMGILGTGGKDNLSSFFKVKVTGQPSKAVFPRL